MSELKAGVLVTPHNEGMCFHRSSAVIAAAEGETEFYLKSEADKFIEDLEESHKKEVEQLLMEIVKLKDAQRWREFSEEKPDDKQWILVYYPNHSNFTTGVEMRRWDEGCKFDVENQELYTKWRPLPKAPEDGK